MVAERNIEIAVQRGLLVSEEIDRAEAHREAQRREGRELSLWDAAKELGTIERSAAESIEHRHSTEQLGAPTIAGYELVDQIGSGGMGEVFLGVRGRDEEAAIKLLPSRLVRDTEYLGRFQREIQAMQALDHPHIVRYLEHGTHHSRPYLVMEVVRGVSLKEHILQQGALGELEVRVLMRQMIDALDAAWHAGVVHRDVKPANILLGAPQPGSGDPFCAKLCDFGLVKFQEGRHSAEPLTHTGIAIGTPHYMSPEQATGDRSADPRHDVYGLAATVYHALQGKTLYSGRSSAVIMYKQATSRLDMRPLRERRVSEELIALLEAMLAKPKDVRLADFNAVRERFVELPPVPEGRSRTPIVVSERHHLSDRHRARLAEALPEAPATPTGSRSFAPGGLILAVAAVLLLSVGLWLTVTGGSLGGQRVVNADPESLAALLADPGTEAEALTIELAPGRYVGPWRVGAERPIHLRAVEAGVVFEVPRLAGDTAAISLAPAGELTVDGIEIAWVPGTVVAVGAGGRLTLRASRLAGDRLAVVAGELELHRCVARGGDGIEARTDAQVHILDSRVDARESLVAGTDTHLKIRDSHLRSEGGNAQEAIHLVGGSLIAERTLVEAQGLPVAIALRGSGLCELDTCVISGAGVGLRVQAVGSGLVHATTIEAEVIGVEWSGQAEGWTWSEVRIDAPRVTAVEVPGLTGDGRGTDRQQLAHDRGR